MMYLPFLAERMEKTRPTIEGIIQQTMPGFPEGTESEVWAKLIVHGRDVESYADNEIGMKDPDIIGLREWTEAGKIIHIEVLHNFKVYNKKRMTDRRTAYTIERELLNFEFPLRSILTGDMNAHHPWWNAQTKSQIDHLQLLQIREAHDFDLTNTPDETTYDYRTGKGISVMNITFTTPDNTTIVCNWAIGEGPTTGQTTKC